MLQPFDDGTTVSAGTQAVTRSGQRSGNMSDSPVLGNRAHTNVS